MAIDKHTTALLDAMEFARQDLLANRKGQLTPFQHQKIALMTDMVIEDLEDAPPLFMPGLVKLLLIAVAVGIAYWLGGFGLLKRWLGPFCLPAVVLLGLLLLGPMLWRQFQYLAVRSMVPDILTDRLEDITLHSVSGEGKLEVEDLGVDGTNYWLSVGDKQFALTTAASRVFQDGETYRVFYVYIGADEFMVSVEGLKEK
jgi:hypothetical protein